MKRANKPMNLLEKVYVGGLLLIFGLIVLHAPLTVYAGTLIPAYVLIIKAWKELLMGALLILALVIVTRRRAWGGFVRDPLIWLSLALAILYAVSIQYGQPKAYAAGLLIDLRYVLYLVLVYVAARLFPGARRAFLTVGLIGAIVVVGFGLLQFVLPKDFLRILGYSKDTIAPYTTIDSYEGLVRLQSTLRGPNPLGAYGLVVVLVAGAVALRAQLGRRAKTGLWVLAAGALIVTFASYSRSAYLGLIVGAAVVGVVVIGRRLRSRRAVIAIVAGLVVIIAGLLLIRSTTFYSSVLDHEVAGSGPSVDSNEGHSMSLRAAGEDAVRHPLGSGTGSTGSASLLSSAGGDIVENQYLFVAHEAGWAALVVFLALYGLLLARAYGMRRDPVALGVFASGVGLAVIGTVLPVFADDTVSIIWFGLAALVSSMPSAPRLAKGREHEPAAE